MMSRDEAGSLIRERLDPRHHSLIRNEHIEAAIAIGREFYVIVLYRDEEGSLVSCDELFSEWREFEDDLYEVGRGTSADEEERTRQHEIMTVRATAINIVPGPSPG